MNGLKILGFDIGISSIGWAYVEGGELKDCGVRIFTKAENPKDGSSLAFPRREARGARRRLAHRKARLNELKRLITAEFGLNLEDFLANAGELPKAYKLSKCEIADYDSYEKRKAIRKNNNTQEKEKLAQELEKCDTNPYKLRAKALEHKLEPSEFARVILHIAKHRGYGNKHAKESSDEKNKKKKSEQDGIKGGIAKNKGYKANYETIGAYLYNEFYGKPRSPEQIQAKIEALKADYKKEKIKPEKWNKNKLEKQSPNQQNNVRNKLKNYERCLKQDWLKEELEIIFAKQREFGFAFKGEKYKIYDENRALKELDFESAVIETAFLQRPLKSFADKVGKCTFFADESRAPKDSLSAMEFRALGHIIGILINIDNRISDGKEQNTTGKIYTTKENIYKILQIVLDKGKIKYKKLREIIGLPESIRFYVNAKLDYTKSVKEAEDSDFLKFDNLTKFKSALGGRFERFTRTELDTIAVCITLIKDRIVLFDTLKSGNPPKDIPLNESQKIALNSASKKLDEAKCKELSKLSFNHFIAQSFKALEAILPFMRGENGECKRYDEAWRAAGLKEVAKKTQKDDKLPPLIEYEPNLANPVVARALSEYRKVLNALLEKHGKVHKIHLEFTREAGVSSTERKELIAEQNKRFKANEEARKRCAEFGLNPSGKNILKLKLWQEQNGICVYSGKNICRKHLLDSNALQIDHIYPYSRSDGDDSYMNKVLVFTSENQNKLNKTPYEAFGSDSTKWNMILGLIQKLPKPKKNRIANKNFADKESGFIARNIVDTSYIATLTASYTDAFIEFLPLAESEDTTLGRGEKGSKKHISVVSGSLTATMRHYWGLNTLLDNKNSEVKDRSNHLHHAIDAIIIAYANDSIIKAFSDFKKTQEQNKAKLIAKEIESSEYKISRRFFSPSHFANNEEFRQAIKRKILGEVSENGELSGGIFVSKPPRKRARGALHKETFSSVNDSALLKTYGGQEGVKRAINLGKIRQIGSKVADNGPMVRTDIFRHKSSGKFYGVPIYTMDYALGKLPNKAVVSGKDKAGVIKEWLEMDENYEFCFSLFKDDLIKVQKKEMKGAELCYFKRFKTSGPSIEVVKHDNFVKNITPNQEQIFKLSKDRLSIEESMIAFQNLEIFEKWQVSPLGKRDFKANGDKPEIRQEIRLKSSPKDSRQKAKK